MARSVYALEYKRPGGRWDVSFSFYNAGFPIPTTFFRKQSAEKHAREDFKRNKEHRVGFQYRVVKYTPEGE